MLSREIYEHNKKINRTLDYSRWFISLIAGAGVAVESPEAVIGAALVYTGASIVQIAKGYLFRNREEYLMSTVLRDSLAALSGFISASWINGETSVRELGGERIALLDSLSAAGSVISHLSSRNDLRGIEKELEPRVPLL